MIIKRGEIKKKENIISRMEQEKKREKIDEVHRKYRWRKRRTCKRNAGGKNVKKDKE